MRIWKLTADVNKYAYFSSEPRLSVKEFQSFKGRTIGDDWKELFLIRIDNGKLPLGDADGFDFGFLVSESAKEFLSNLLNKSVEFLPTVYNGRHFYLMNVLTSLDCLDKDNSDIMFSRTEKERIIAINRYSFIEQAIGNNKIFRLKDSPLQGPFITESVVEEIRKSNLKGFCFDLVWDSSLPAQHPVSFGGVIKSEF